MVLGLCRSLCQVDCGCYCCGRVMRPADAPEEQPNNFIAYDFVNDAVMSGDRSGCQLIEVVEECVEVDRRIRSPMAVEPRRSENSRVIGISTPVM